MKQEDIGFEVDGLKLRGRLYRPATSKPLAVLFIHGWTGLPNDNAARELAENDYTSMTFSLSGHNNSDGNIEEQTSRKSLEEALAAYDFFKEKLPHNTKIGLAGNSFGGYISILLSSKRPVACLALRVASNYVDEHFELKRIGMGSENAEVSEWRRRALEPDATMALRALHDFEGPVQILEAELDDMVPHQSTQNYVEAVKDKSKLDYHLMKGWPHSLGIDPKRNRNYQQILLNWLNEQL